MEKHDEENSVPSSIGQKEEMIRAINEGVYDFHFLFPIFPLFSLAPFGLCLFSHAHTNQSFVFFFFFLRKMRCSKLLMKDIL